MSTSTLQSIWRTCCRSRCKRLRGNGLGASRKCIIWSGMCCSSLTRRKGLLRCEVLKGSVCIMLWITISSSLGLISLLPFFHLFHLFCLELSLISFSADLLIRPLIHQKLHIFSWLVIAKVLLSTFSFHNFPILTSKYSVLFQIMWVGNPFRKFLQSPSQVSRITHQLNVELQPVKLVPKFESCSISPILICIFQHMLLHKVCNMLHCR